MAGMDNSFLSSATSFNREKTTQGNDDLKADSTFVDMRKKTDIVDKKRKRKKKTDIVDKKRKGKENDPSAGVVKGFSVFIKAERASEDFQQAKDKQKLSRGKGDYYRQLKRDAIFRENHMINVSGRNVPSPLRSFAELESRYNCESSLLQNLLNHGFTEPTLIQSQAIAVLLSGRDCIASAQDGIASARDGIASAPPVSERTFAFVCPILIKLKASADGIRALILCPTRKLVAQTFKECRMLAEGTQFRIRMMEERSCDILISIPSRVQSAVQKGLDLSKVEFLVLDASDELVKPGMEKEVSSVQSVVKACSNRSISRSSFCGTLPDEVDELARKIMRDAVLIMVGFKNNAVAQLVKQRLVYVGSEDGKLEALHQSFLARLNWRVLIFVQNKERAIQLHQNIKSSSDRAYVIHDDLSKEQRERAVGNFLLEPPWVLISTDIAARGMNFNNLVNCVINYDLPSAREYTTRIARAEKKDGTGEAITLYTDEDTTHLRKISNVLRSAGCKVPGWLKPLRKKKLYQIKNHKRS